MADDAMTRWLEQEMTRRKALELFAKGATAVGLTSILAACGQGPGLTAGTSPNAQVTPAGSIPPRSSFLPLTGSGTATILDAGGPYTDAYHNVFYEPFKALSGITIDQQTRPGVESAVASQMKAQADTGQVQWDAIQMSSSTYVLVKQQGLLDTVGMDKYDFHVDQFAQGANHDDFSAATTVAVVLGYRTDKYTGSAVPSTFADFWDVDKFPGRRALYKSGLDLMEPAVLSAGVGVKNVYPIDVDLAFAQLDKIKPHVDQWFDQLAASSQLLIDGSVDMAITFISRTQAAADAGAPVVNAWGEWISANNGWVIPKGAPNAENARKCLAYMTDPQLMAAITKYVKVGLPNLKAYDFIDPSLANTLPGSQPTQAGQVPVDPFWRAENGAAVLDRFTTWFSS